MPEEWVSTVYDNYGDSYPETNLLYIKTFIDSGVISWFFAVFYGIMLSRCRFLQPKLGNSDYEWITWKSLARLGCVYAIAAIFLGPSYMINGYNIPLQSKIWVLSIFSNCGASLVFIAYFTVLPYVFHKLNLVSK